MALKALQVEYGRHRVRTRTAAKQLGVSVDLLNGLIYGGQVEGWVKDRSPHEPAYYIYVDQIDLLRERMGQISAT